MTLSKTLSASAAGLCLLLLSSAAHATLFADDEARLALEGVKSTVNAHAQSLMEQTSAMEELRREVRELRGTVEMMQHERDETKTARKNEDERRRYQLYKHALLNFNYGNFAGAAADLEIYLGSESSPEPDANFWLGGAYYGVKECAKADDAFKLFMDSNKNSDKAPKAVLLQAQCRLDAADTAGAKPFLQKIILKYPESAEAREAQETLTTLAEAEKAAKKAEEAATPPVEKAPVKKAKKGTK